MNEVDLYILIIVLIKVTFTAKKSDIYGNLAKNTYNHKAYIKLGWSYEHIHGFGPDEIQLISRVIISDTCWVTNPIWSSSNSKPRLNAKLKTIGKLSLEYSTIIFRHTVMKLVMKSQ